MEFAKGLPLARRIETIERLARWAASSWAIWKFVEDLDEDAVREGPLAEFGAFLVYDAHIHREAAIIHLNALFERKPNTVNIDVLLNHLRAHRRSLRWIESLDIQISNQRPQIEKLYIIRGAAVGHRTSAKTYDQIFSAARMTVAEFEGLLNLARRSATVLRRIAGLPKPRPQYNPVDSLKALLEEALQSQARRD